MLHKDNKYCLMVSLLFNFNLNFFSLTTELNSPSINLSAVLSVKGIGNLIRQIDERDHVCLLRILNYLPFL